jgi:hypothetical protein
MAQQIQRWRGGYAQKGYAPEPFRHYAIPDEVKYS